MCLIKSNMAGILDSKPKIFLRGSLMEELFGVFCWVGFVCLFSKLQNNLLVAKHENIKKLNVLNFFRLFELFRKLRTTNFWA